MEAFTEFILAAAGSPWVLLVVLLCTIIDSVIPPVPSESLIVGLAAISVTTGEPSLWLLGAVAVTGAVIGDNIAYEIGRRVGTQRFAWMRRPAVVRAMDWAGAALERRVSSAMLAGRFVPVGRIAINMTAGATGIPRRVFRPLSVLAGGTWALYSVAIGSVAGNWVSDNPLLGAVIAIAIGVVVGFVIDAVMTRLRRRREVATSRPRVSDRVRVAPTND